jgi:CRP/FNR family transcriptional regulator
MLPEGVFPLLDPLAHTPGSPLGALLERVVPTGSVLFEAGDPCAGFPLVLAGEVQVSRLTESGREIELYRVHPGEICLISTQALLECSPYQARGVAAREVRLMALPRSDFTQLLDADSQFRRFVLTQFSLRMVGLMHKVEEVAFQHLEQRLAAMLVAAPDQWTITHQALAERLGAAREAVSRQLKRLENRQLVQMQRGCIVVRDRPALQVLACVTGITDSHRLPD